MKILSPHRWDITIPEAREIQATYAQKIVRTGLVRAPRLIAGVDISREREGKATAAVVVLAYPELEIVENNTVVGAVTFPYVPGLLSYREAPLVLAACAGLHSEPDLIVIDGQGIAHPRRLGLAAHVGLILDRPTIGCAKSRLIGEYEEPGRDAGSRSDLIDNGEVIGAAVRTRSGCRPLFISIGNRIDLSSAVEWVIRCCRGYRIPEPTRLAHIAAGRSIKTGVAV